jgi:hypothetical protein
MGGWFFGTVRDFFVFLDAALFGRITDRINQGFFFPETGF